MYKITLAQFRKIHTDYRGVCNNKREAFNGSIRSAAGLEGWGELLGTTVLTEGIHFEIVPLIIVIKMCEGPHKTGTFYSWQDAQKAVSCWKLPHIGNGYDKMWLNVKTKSSEYEVRADLQYEYSSLEYHFSRHVSYVNA